jgi:hypothetical protein
MLGKLACLVGGHAWTRQVSSEVSGPRGLFSVCSRCGKEKTDTTRRPRARPPAWRTSSHVAATSPIRRAADGAACEPAGVRAITYSHYGDPAVLPHRAHYAVRCDHGRRSRS